MKWLSLVFIIFAPEKSVKKMEEKNVFPKVLQELVTDYERRVGSELNAETMLRLNGAQLTLLAYSIFRREMLEGGMVQLIHNGYGPFIFENPFAKAMRLWRLKDFSKYIYSARKLYEKDAAELTKDCTDEEFMALYEQHPELDDTDDEFVTQEPAISKLLADYVTAHPDSFK